MTIHSKITADLVLDCTGMACPMPIVKTKKAMEELHPGQVIEVQATDKGSLADLQSWTKRTGHQYIGTLQNGVVLQHYLRKSNPDEVKEETSYGRTISNEEFVNKLAAGETVTLLDVREPAEYLFHRIPGAISIPMGQLHDRLSELQAEDEIYVVCRTGSRSGMACHLLTEQGFTHVTNVEPGMSAWTGPTESNEA